jgi:hypothetical protein
MFERDFAQFATLLDDAFSLNPNWKVLSPRGKALYFKALEQYSLETVSMAMTAHIRDAQRGKFQPAPADLIAKIEGSAPGDGRPGVEEAWALALLATDEHETVVWTEEMRDAFMLCRPVLERGDEVGARMAFKEAYLRMIVDAGRANRAVRWELSPGRSGEKRALAIERAAAVGRLPAPQVSLLLPAPVKEAEINREGLARVRAECAKLIPASERIRARREAELQAERDRDAEQKREITNKVAQYQKGQPA